MKVPFLITDGSVTVYLRGQSYVINSSSSAAYSAAIEAIRAGNFDAIPEIVDRAKVIERSSGGKIEVRNNAVFYKGEQVHNYVVTKILQWIDQGISISPLVNFLERLLLNPSKNSVDQLYKFLEHGNMPIDEDGFFYGYKGIRLDYMDVYSGKFDNHPGNKIECDRNKVCDDPAKGCAEGFHVGSHKYASHWGPRVVLVRVDPADVVSVPSDCNFQKLRTMRYVVVDECTGLMSDTFVKRDSFSNADSYDRDVDVELAFDWEFD